jgi:hypothetical protein
MERTVRAFKRLYFAAAIIAVLFLVESFLPIQLF